MIDKRYDPDVIRTRNLLIWSQTRYRCATESIGTLCIALAWCGPMDRRLTTYQEIAGSSAAAKMNKFDHRSIDPRLAFDKKCDPVVICARPVNPVPTVITTIVHLNR
ncbi:hypothetical protein DPMN_117524 [Dreissena polymorpha]|uniref:Uncharacterized protein n=1 Tax=Dreissena polymorpha TaxID=45954 RepID=A0A9D4KQS8_DREPO|nr:hypothetical protein DPMN_117524 [Dreissena polymorpha]